MSAQLLLRFVSCCRAAGLRLSPSEVLDSMQQLELIDILEESDFRTMLRSNFAKSRREQVHFDRLYQLFFHELRDGSLLDDDPVSRRIEEIMKRLERMYAADADYRAILDFLMGDSRAFLERLQRIRESEPVQPQTVKFNWSSMMGRLQLMIQLGKMRETLFRLLGQDRDHYNAEDRRAVAAYFDRRMESAYSLLLNEPRPDNAGIKEVKTTEQRLKALGDRPFSQLSEREVAEMREAIGQLVRKLKNIVSLRWAARDRGSLDAKKTLRRASRYQGIPVEIHFRKRPPRKTKIVVLCDVSSSVWSAARFMLNMVYSLQECFSRVHSFIFVAGLAEVTEIFDDNEINIAIEKVLTETDLNYYTATDYGETFRHFRRSYMDYLDKKTTLIILGDARTNYFSPEERILDEMREKSRRLIWLNPEPESVWNSGDSEMYTYRPYCHELRPCRNLNQLVDFIEDLVL